MKNFIGKINSLLGIIGLSIMTVLSVIFFVLACIFKNSVIGNVIDSLENPTKIENLIPLLLFVIGLIISSYVIIYSIVCLIHNNKGRFSLFNSIFLLIYHIASFIVVLYFRILYQDIENSSGINIYILSWCGGLIIFFSLMIFLGTIMNAKQVSSV